jgi:uncharacterized protein YvpB
MKIIISIIVLLIILISGFIGGYYVVVIRDDLTTVSLSDTNLINVSTINEGNFELFENGVSLASFIRLEDAIYQGEKIPNSFIREMPSSTIIWNNFVQYNVFVNNQSTYYEFKTFKDAVYFARQHERALVYNRRNNSLVWSSSQVLPPYHKILGVPLISQLPALPRGCEVTSLAMLLNYKGVDVDKMTLAQQIRKDPTPHSIVDGVVHFGNPNYGFVGDMKNINNPGYGVYSAPIYDLLKEYYFPNDAIKLTGADFEDVLQFVYHGSPVWVVINTRFVYLPPYQFQTWQSPSGPIDVTMRMHAVVVTGFDEYRIYFNDPLNLHITSASRSDFIAAWEQMGSHAVTVMV